MKNYPTFDKVAQEFIDFIGSGKLIIHNANFDMNFLNWQLKKEGYKVIPDAQVFCTLVHARKKFPGSPASLDALCKRYGVDNSARTKHGALLDAELLADMYLELMGGAQEGLMLDSGSISSNQHDDTITVEQKTITIREARSFPASKEELEAHDTFIEKHLPDGLWKKLENG